MTLVFCLSLFAVEKYEEKEADDCHDTSQADKCDDLGFLEFIASEGLFAGGFFGGVGAQDQGVLGELDAGELLHEWAEYGVLEVGGCDLVVGEVGDELVGDVALERVNGPHLDEEVAGVEGRHSIEGAIEIAIAAVSQRLAVDGVGDLDRKLSLGNGLHVEGVAQVLKGFVSSDGEVDVNCAEGQFGGFSCEDGCLEAVEAACEVVEGGFMLRRIEDWG